MESQNSKTYSEQHKAYISAQFAEVLQQDEQAKDDLRTAKIALGARKSAANRKAVEQAEQSAKFTEAYIKNLEGDRSQYELSEKAFYLRIVELQRSKITEITNDRQEVAAHIVVNPVAAADYMRSLAHGYARQRLVFRIMGVVNHNLKEGLSLVEACKMAQQAITEECLDQALSYARRGSVSTDPASNAWESFAAEEYARNTNRSFYSPDFGLYSVERNNEKNWAKDIDLENDLVQPEDL